MVDNKYVISLCVKSLPEKIYFLDIIKDIDKNVEYDMSIYLNKLDPINTLNNIVYNISSNSSELNTISKSQRNIDIINKSNENAINLRKKIQIENQEIYNIIIIFTFYSYNLNQLLKIISNFKSKLYSKEISADVTNFRHLDFYLSNLPLSIKKSELSNKLYITTSALSNIFPFYSNNFIDKEGVLLGYTQKDRRMCIIDIFANKYQNSNICIFGSSGSGKSFFTKMFIIRNFFKNTFQVILDLEHEYVGICKNLFGQYISSNTYFNILQITSKELQVNNFLDNKIEKVTEFLSKTCMLKSSEKVIVREEIEAIYNKFGINNDENTVLKKFDDDTLYLDSEIIENEKFPTLIDLEKNISDKKIKEKLKSKINSDLKFFSKVTNIDMENMLYVIDINIFINNADVICYIMENLINNYIGRYQSIIYIDELWRYSKSKKILDNICTMYKTIRKRNGSIVAITQDITDLFSYKDGFYASSILNNSCFKVIFKTDYKDSSVFDNVIRADSKRISNLKKGEAYFIVDNNCLELSIVANEYEKGLLNENGNSN